MGLAAYFDIIITAVVILLALKGIFSGFIREFCSCVGIIGGVLIASRFSASMGDLINSMLKIQSQTLINLIGFVVILGAIWVLSLVLAEILVRFAKFIKLGVFDKILGVFMAGAKIFLVLSVIFFTFSKINFLSNFTISLQGESKIYPFMITIGDFIVKTDFYSTVRKNASEMGNSALEEMSKNITED